MHAEILEKSTQSLNAAKLLANQSLYPSTVNRAYYACVQYIMHILIEKLKYDRIKFYADVRNSKDGTHGWASKLMETELIKKNPQDFKWFQKEIKEFKKLRVLADYHEDEISSDDGRYSITRASTIIDTMKNNFK